MIVKLTCRLLAASFALVAGLSATETYNFNPDWRFLKADPTGAAAAGFDDSSWQQVSAPHTYNDIDTFDDWSPLGHVGEINQNGAAAPGIAKPSLRRRNGPASPSSSNSRPCGSCAWSI